MNHDLLDKNLISEVLTRDAAWEWSHGAKGDYLGMGLLYYSVVYALKAKVAVCLGSGGGFVPRLMRQAQRDLGIATSSRTILVDANKPEVGWGSPQWLADDSFFRTQFPDVELVIDTTKAAATNFFAPEQIKIDYLHIDADHSFNGCLEDFETYRPFLRAGSIVTMHDTNRNDAGVKHVVEYVRTMSEFEVVDFKDVGEGTALLRLGSSRTVEAPSRENGNVISVTRHPGAIAVGPAEKDWKYLESKAFATRYVLAAHFVAPCQSVIEIGGSKTPIDLFLTGHHDSVIVLDPLIRESHRSELNGKPCEVSHVRARFQDVDWNIPAAADYGMVMMGLEIQGLEPHHYEKLFQLITGAKVTVIEFPPSWEPSRKQFEIIKSSTNTRVTFQTQLNLENNDYGDLTNSWPPRCDRMIYVLEPRIYADERG
jgi:methyltransferase family protein